MPDGLLCGRWEYTGSEMSPVVPGQPPIAMEVYTWHAPVRAGKLSIPFYCVRGETPRRFYGRPVLKAWEARRTPDQFLDAVFRVGHHVLQRLEAVFCPAADSSPSTIKGAAYGTSAMPRLAFEFYRAVFRHRQRGRVALRRRFRAASDLFDGPERQAECLVPGVGAKRSDRRWNSQDVLEVVHREVWRGLEGGRGQAVDDDTLPISAVPPHTQLDMLLVDGAFEPVRARALWDALHNVSRSMIYGIDVDRDEEIVAHHRQEWNHFLTRLIGSFAARRKGKQFDEWLRVEREQRFIRLLPKPLPEGDKGREEARQRGLAYYRRTLWGAIRSMARCYGALTFIAALDFLKCPLIKPTHAECRLFRLLNAPQLYLAGLPLAFVPQHELRWLVPVLLQLWNEERFSPHNYEPLSKLLGLYAVTAEGRRQLDREKKAAQRARRDGSRRRRPSRGVPSHDQGFVARSGAEDARGVSCSADVARYDPDPEWDDPLAVPLTQDNTCPRCQGDLNYHGDPALSDGWIIVDVFCRMCDYEGRARFARPPT